MRRVHGNHGRYHKPPKYGDTSGGGEDPVSGMLYLPSAAETNDQVLTRDSTATHGIKWANAGGSGLAYVATPDQFLLAGPMLQGWWDIVNTNANAVINSYTFDNTVPFGGYVSTTGDGGWMVMGASPGPRYGLWATQVWCKHGPAQGKIEVNFGTSSVDQINSADAFGSTRSIQDPPSLAGAWYKTSSTTARYVIDAYNAGTSWPVRTLSKFLIDGADGAMLAADGTSAGANFSADVGKFVAGGDPSVRWWVRLKVNGKNASSSAHNMDIAGIRLVRINGFDTLVT